VWQSLAPHRVEKASLVWEEEHSLLPLDHDRVSYPLYSGLSSSYEEYKDAMDELDGMDKEQIHNIWWWSAPSSLSVRSR
jgi:hypothetical protein